MKWTLIAVAAVVVLLLAATLVGLLLPRGHRSSRYADYKHGPDTVFAVISDFPSLSTWMPGVTAVEPMEPSEGHERWRYRSSEGDLVVEVLERAPPSRLVTRIADTGQPFGGTWTWVLTPSGTGTRVTVTEDGWISNPFFRVMATYVFGLSSTMEKALTALGMRLGETVTPAAPTA